MIPQHDIERVLDAANLEDLIESNGIRLVGAGGGKKKCCCPFHNEKTPSMIVFPNGQYHCFGCGESGNAITWIQKTEGLGFPEAVKHLASRYHVTIHETASAERTAEEREEDQKRQMALPIYQAVQRYFTEQLFANNEDAIIALQYARDRWGVKATATADEGGKKKDKGRKTKDTPTADGDEAMHSSLQAGVNVDEFIRTAGIGYAPDSFDALLTFAHQSQLSEKLMVELGLLKKHKERGNTYDFFRGRLMIPIRNSTNQIVGYSARLIPEIWKKNHPDTEEPAKYINSPDSFLYSKGNTIFGFSQATKVAAKEDMFYLVEGGPDVLRLQSIGIWNTVASLGADWTDAQLQMLKKRVHSLCFIPDIDKVPTGKAWGVGIEKVIGTAERAIRAGFDEVFVLEIPNKSRTEKVDADEYFKRKKDFDELTKEHFIPWYARKLAVGYPNDEMKNIEKVAKMLALVEEDSKSRFYLDQARQYLKTKKDVWMAAIGKIKEDITQQRIRQANKANKSISTEVLEKYGFYEMDNKYVCLGQHGGLNDWSNFVLHPLFHIMDPISPIRLFEIVNEKGQKRTIELKQKELSSIADFTEKVEGLGNYLWKAGRTELTKVKSYLYEITRTAIKIDQLGWQRPMDRADGFFAFGNGIWNDGRFYEADDDGIIEIPTINDGKETKEYYYIQAASQMYKNESMLFQFERRFVHTAYGTFTLQEYLNKLILSFGDNAKVGFAFLLAALFRDIIKNQTKMFPMLNIFGQKGSGKSELGHSLMSFFIVENTPPNIQTTTIAALADAVAQCSNALVHLDEYKNTIDIDKREFLKGLWDGVGRNRMNMDRDKKREATRVDSAIIITGQEMPNIDNALFSRLIFLSTETNQAERTATEREHFEALKSLRRQGCSHLTVEILKYRTQFQAKFPDSWNSCEGDLRTMLRNEVIEERLFNNWLVVLAAFHALRHSIVMPYTYDELLSICAERLKEQNDLTKDSDDVMMFWDVLGFLKGQGKIFNKADYKIDYLKSVRVQREGAKGSEEIRFEETKEILYLRFKNIFELYSMHARSTGQPLLPKTSIAHYLRGLGDCYLGKSTTTRFEVIINGVSQGRSTSTGFIPEQCTDQAYLFDNRVIRTKFGLDLRSYMDGDTDKQDKQDAAADGGASVQAEQTVSISFNQLDDTDDMI